MLASRGAKWRWVLQCFCRLTQRLPIKREILLNARIKGLSSTESVFSPPQKKQNKGFTFILKSFPSFPGKGGFSAWSRKFWGDYRRTNRSVNLNLQNSKAIWNDFQQWKRRQTWPLILSETLICPGFPLETLQLQFSSGSLNFTELLIGGQTQFISNSSVTELLFCRFLLHFHTFTSFPWVVVPGLGSISTLAFCNGRWKSQNILKESSNSPRLTLGFDSYDKEQQQKFWGNSVQCFSVFDRRSLVSQRGFQPGTVWILSPKSWI